MRWHTGGARVWRSLRVSGLAAILLYVFLSACDGGGGGGGRYRLLPEEAEYSREDDFDARNEAAEEARQAVYEERGADVDGEGGDVRHVGPSAVEDYGNYICTQDCSGHEAGFAWAQEHDIADESDCSGNSISFEEGCEAFALERQEIMDRETQEAAEEAAEAAYENYEPEEPIYDDDY